MKLKLSSRLAETVQINPKRLANQDEITTQNELAARLRAAAIRHLEYADDIVARSFRGEYLAAATSNSSSYKTFLRSQGRNGQWATDIEAAALGELFGVNVVVSSEITTGKMARAPQDICIYRAADRNAHTVYIHNINNRHWYVNNNTLGDGNCLYNAFAQELQRILVQEESLTENQPSTRDSNNSTHQATTYHAAPISKTPITEFGLFARHQATDKQVIAHQYQIDIKAKVQAVVLKHPTPKQLEAELETEKSRIAKLSPAEQQQIADDYKFALKLARQDFVTEHAAMLMP